MSTARGTHRPRPLIAEIEGRDQDDRASLRAAWRRIQAARAERGERIGSTDLHVRELLFHVFARDRRGEFGGRSPGVQLTYTEIAAELETTPATARSIVARAVDEFGLLIVHQQRYVTGGQSANRYAIDWAAVHATPATDAASNHPAPSATPSAAADGSAPHAERHPGPATSSATPARPPATTYHPPALTYHPPALLSHPYIEQPRTTPQNQTHSPPPAPVTAACWPVVVSACVSLGMSTDGAASAIAAAQRRELTPAAALELVEAFRRLLAREPKATPGWLHRWLCGRSTPPAEPVAAAPPRKTTTTSPTTQREQLRARIIKAGRAARAPEAVIERRVQEALAAFDAAAASSSTPAG